MGLHLVLLLGLVLVLLLGGCRTPTVNDVVADADDDVEVHRVTSHARGTTDMLVVHDGDGARLDATLPSTSDDRDEARLGSTRGRSEIGID